MVSFQGFSSLVAIIYRLAACLSRFNGTAQGTSGASDCSVRKTSSGCGTASSRKVESEGDAGGIRSDLDLEQLAPSQRRHPK